MVGAIPSDCQASPSSLLRQVLNVILPAMVFVAMHDWRITDEWYPTGGQIVLNGLLADFIFIGALVDRIRPDVLFFRRFLARRAATQQQMNALYKRLPATPAENDASSPA